MSSYVTCRVASWSVKHVGKISKASITRAIINPELSDKVEFIIDQFGHRYDGKPMTLTEAFAGGVKSINIRYNQDRDVAVIDVVKTHAALVKARDAVKPTGDLSPSLATVNASDLSPVIGGR